MHLTQIRNHYATADLLTAQTISALLSGSPRAHPIPSSSSADPASTTITTNPRRTKEGGRFGRSLPIVFRDRMFLVHTQAIISIALLMPLLRQTLGGTGISLVTL